MITINRCRGKATREDFIVRGFGKRAIRIVLMANYNTLENTSNILSEFELYYLLLAVAQIVNKRGWKTGVVDIAFFNGPTRHARVYLKNPAGYSIGLGAMEELVEIDHFLNDSYHTPKGFWIK